MSTQHGRLLAALYTLSASDMAQVAEAVKDVPPKELSRIWNSAQDIRYSVELRWRSTLSSVANPIPR
jgi:hypothetical protein